MEERLQKIISQSGFCSRRKAEDYLRNGKVFVNGKQTSLGDKADLARDQVVVDGQALLVPSEKTYLMLHKPKGYLTTLSDERGRKTVADLVLDAEARVWPVGRLDWDTEGLLIMTNDGKLTHYLTHPSHEVEKEYLVWVLGDVEAAIPILSGSICLDGEKLTPAKVRPLKQGKRRGLLSITIHEGKNRQVRKMCAFAGLKVQRLKRIREGNLSLDSTLLPGRWRKLSDTEIANLKK